MAIHYRRDDNHDHLEIHGNLMEIVAEVTYLPRRVYEQLEKTDPVAAEVFKELTMDVMGDSNSPVWM